MNAQIPPRSNSEFADVISQSFQAFLDTNSRSTQKLKPLHGAIATDLARMLGADYKIKSQGYEEGREAQINGRYVNKNVDVTILHNDEPVAGVSIKFIMENFSQNAMNYFEIMLGETANIRSNGVPYFQVIILFDSIPHYKYKKDKNNNHRLIIDHWERFSADNAERYVKLSQDNPELYKHTPDKTLIIIVHISENKTLKDKSEYVSFYKENTTVELSLQEAPFFDNGVIYNDYESFMWKIYHKIMSL